jgi:hypothetical protein
MDKCHEVMPVSRVQGCIIVDGWVRMRAPAKPALSDFGASVIGDQSATTGRIVGMILNGESGNFRN